LPADADMEDFHVSARNRPSDVDRRWGWPLRIIAASGFLECGGGA
jgi:hypothetical protein